MRSHTRWNYILPAAAGVLLYSSRAHAMHISEGLLPVSWALMWFAVAVPFVVWGVRQIRAKSRQASQYKALVGLVGAAVFIISVLPIPVPVAGSCSHPCGTGLAAILIGPAPTVVVAAVALLLQALFLAHGGLSTLGGNILSMGVAGAFVGYGMFRLTTKFGLPVVAAAFLSGVIGDWATYAVTSFELTCALHAPGELGQMFLAIAVAFVPTQLPLGILEGFISAGAYRFVMTRRPDLLKLLSGEAIK